MKKALLLCLSAVFVCTLVAPASAVAVSRVRVYEGTTSQGHKMSFATAVVRGNTRLVLFEHDVDVTCPDTSEWGYGSGIYWGLSGPKIVDGNLHVFEHWGSDAFTLDGLIGGGAASGSLVESFAALTEDATDAQFCTTGPLTWTAEKVKLRNVVRLPARSSRTVTVTSPDGSQLTTRSPLAG